MKRGRKNSIINKKTYNRNKFKYVIISKYRLNLSVKIRTADIR